MKAIVLSLLFFVAFVASQTPSKPTWPAAFSSTIIETSPNAPDHYDRYFYDAKLNSERTDGTRRINEVTYFRTLIKNATDKVEYEVLVDVQNDQTTCFTRASATPILVPNFSNFTYVGKALVGVVVTNLWLDQVRNSTSFYQYFDDATTRTPVRIDGNNQQRGGDFTWTFREVDVGAQDPNLFVLPPALKALCPAPTHPTPNAPNSISIN